MSESNKNLSAKEIIASFYQKAKSIHKNIGFPDALDIRVLAACEILGKEQIASPFLIGNKDEILRFAHEHNAFIEFFSILDPRECIDIHDIEEYAATKKAKGMTIHDAKDVLVNNSLYAAGILLKKGMIDGCIAGNISSTAEVIKAGLSTVGKASGIETISSFFIMILPDGNLYIYADGAVVPSPTAEQLCDIAYTTAISVEQIMGMQARIAFLSFSTMGSANHPDIDKVQQAVKLFQLKYPSILAEGEIQFDAAIVPSIATMKIKDSILKGSANILIFPDLDAGNIAYKITERLAGAKAIGPIIQGLEKPYCDLSRGCSAEDIVLLSAICSIM